MIKDSTIENTNLPADWEIKTLGDVSVFSQGIQVGLKQHIINPKDGYVRFIRIVDYTQNTEDIRYVPNPGEKYFVDEDDIVMVRYGSPGLIGRGKSGVIANNLFRIKINIENLTNDYLSYFLSQYKIQKYLSSQGSATMPALNFGQLKTVDVLFPNSIAQQKQIVSIIDKAFAAIDTAKANAEQNLKNTKELFESYCQNIFENDKENWNEKSIGEVCSLFQGLAINAKTKHLLVEKSTLPLLRIKDLRNNTVEQYINDENYPQSNLVNKEDLIYTRTGNSLGLVFRGRYGILHNNSFKIVPKELLTRDYLFIWLKNPNFKSKIFSLASKAAQPDITHKIFKLQKIKIPPIKEQQLIVKKINNVSAETKKLETIYTQKIADLNEMKKSVLQKAFSGQLNTIS